MSPLPRSTELPVGGAVVSADAVLLVHDVQNHWLQMFEDPTPWFDRIVQLRDACDAAGVPDAAVCWYALSSSA